jgi:translation initiation factor 2 beta subunit (eIF-2beta)/eIF-5
MKCKKCKNPKTSEDFYHREDGRLKSEKCKACILAEMKKKREDKNEYNNIYFSF